MRRAIFLAALAFGLGGCNLLFGLGEAVEREGAGGASSSSGSTTDATSTADSSSATSGGGGGGAGTSSTGAGNGGQGGAGGEGAGQVASSSSSSSGGGGQGGADALLDCGGDEPVETTLFHDDAWATFAIAATDWIELAGVFNQVTTTGDVKWARSQVPAGLQIDLRLAETFALAAGDVIEIETRSFTLAGHSFNQPHLGVYTELAQDVAIAEIDVPTPEGVSNAEFAQDFGVVPVASPAARLRLFSTGTQDSMLYLDYVTVRRWRCP